MGCSQSKPTTSSTTSSPTAKLVRTNSMASRTSKKASSNPPAPPATRRRADSWAIAAAANGEAATSNTTDSNTSATNGVHASATAVLNAPSKSPKKPLSVESQWKWIWDTHSGILVDPVDIPAVLDSLLSQMINRLTAVQLSFLQRKVRSITKSLPATTAQSSKVIKVFSNNMSAEARLLLEKQNLLAISVMQRILPVTVLQPAAIILAQHLTFTEQLVDRVASIAAQAALDAGMEMDVNKLQKSGRSGWDMPKPSLVSPDPEDPPVYAEGISFPALSFLIAIAAAGSRTQRLHLLFYLLLDEGVLIEFLSNHPAGGIPTFLLEVDQNCVLGLPGLTHYHYFGHAFLPCSDVNPPPKFVASSRLPVTVSAKHVQQVVRSILFETSESRQGSENSSNAAGPANDASASETSTSLHKKGSLLSSSLHGRHRNKSDTVSSTHSSQTAEVFFWNDKSSALSDPMSRLHQDDYQDAALHQESAEQFEAACSNTSKSTWTLGEFAHWAAAAFDDLALEVLMFRLLCNGIFPSPSMERAVVAEKWDEWSKSFAETTSENAGTLEMITQSVQALLETCQAVFGTPVENRRKAHPVWGGLGGMDGGGGLGHGVLYCIPKLWWDSWVAYAGWSWMGDVPINHRQLQRPPPLSTECLLDGSNILRGTLGSYEVMKEGLEKGKDYVLVPPAVWDVLYELYGGGPPLPRMVLPLRTLVSNGSLIDKHEDSSVAKGSSDELDRVVDGLNGCAANRVMRLPNALSVNLYPWVIHCHLCDPLQPYRRGELGSFTIRVMVAREQPLWRLYVELITRFPLHVYKAYDSSGCGRARLWRRVDPSELKGPLARYGPWSLLCKNREAVLPMMTNFDELEQQFTKFKESWTDYADSATVESMGIVDDDHIMLEFAVQSKSGDLIWPREAAAQAGRVRRIADEDAEFRNLMQGLDKEGNILLKPNIKGMEIDAMDSMGRWYLVKILDVEIFDEDTENDEELELEELEAKDTPISRKKIKVTFSEHGGHEEWIDVSSERIAKAGRFTNEAEQQNETLVASATKDQTPSNGENKAKVVAGQKKINGADANAESSKLCALPGFGACGLTNLGNTCYMNSALQCISYLPLLRAYILSGQFKTSGDLNRDNPLGTGGKLVEEIADLLRAMWSARVGEKTPTRFRAQLGKLNSQFSGADQQDAQEFLTYILDGLHEDCSRVRKKPYVEALEDEWVSKTELPRVGEESWRRFLRRNRSFLADMGMGQVLNTVSCPNCAYKSRNFDPFSLLSLSIPTVADVMFQCTVIRRATARNCPWVLNRPRKGEKRQRRFSWNMHKGGPPSDTFVAEQYMVTMSRLADNADLRHELQKLCGIASNQLRLCRVEEYHAEKTLGSPVDVFKKIIPVGDKDGPCSQLARKRLSPEEDVSTPTQLIAFELTIKPRMLAPKEVTEEKHDEATDEEEDDGSNISLSNWPTREERDEIEKYIKMYGDENEGRVLDTDVTIIARAVSRSMWPRSEADLRVGLRVDARDHRKNWYPGSVVEVLDDKVNAGDADTGQEVNFLRKKVKVHFDNFASKWDETYTLTDFESGAVRPLYTSSMPRPKLTEFMVYHRHLGEGSKHAPAFGMSFMVQCQPDWSNARAGAHILAQLSRFLDSGTIRGSVPRSYEKVQMAMSELIDVLVDFDSEYIRMALGLSEHNQQDGSERFRNPSFDPSVLIGISNKKVSQLLQRLPFDLKVGVVEGPGAKASPVAEELSFSYSLLRTIGNYVTGRNVVIVYWKESSGEKTGLSNHAVFYREPTVYIDEVSAEAMRKTLASRNDAKSKPGLDLGTCLTEFCKSQQLSENWRCPRCKEIREVDMKLWKLPDLMTFHIKRFNMSARWREKITTRVNFPLTGLDLSEWCHQASPMLHSSKNEGCVYDLIGVMNHYGSMTGGHYVSMVKATHCGREGREEVAYSFSGVGTNILETEGQDGSTGWRLSRPKADANQIKASAAISAKSVAHSAEPTWLQFDDEVVEPIPPKQVVSDMAYVLFYRKREITPANIAKYSTLE